MIVNKVSLQTNDSTLVKSAYGEYNIIFDNIYPNDIIEDGDFLFIDKNVDTIDFKDKFSFDATEQNKTIFSSLELMDKLSSMGLTKKNKIVIVGGGITQDVGSLCAALYKRGVPWVFFPTTLLSMCDSCIGSKMGVNHNGAKNQIGLFYPPKAVYINTKYLDTLKSSDISSGMGEILKLYQIGGIKFDPNKPLETMIRESLLVKKSIIEYDEFEKTIRQSLNYGHTFGHVIEVISEYTIPHGEAVIWGMLLVNRYFNIKDDEFESNCKRFIKPFRFTFTNEMFTRVLLQDKKTQGKFITLIKTEFGNTEFVKTCITDCFINDITSSLLKIQDQL